LGILDRLLRRDEESSDPLGEGVWRYAHDRFRRAVNRYHDLIAVVPDRAVRSELEEVGADLMGAMAIVQVVCVRGQRAAPTDEMNLPGSEEARFHEAHRGVSRAATLCSQASEAAMQARIGVLAQDSASVRTAIEAARRTAKHVHELVGSAFAAVNR
jgi:hypothetical protein